MAGGEERRLGRKLGGTEEHACPGTDGQSRLSAGPWARGRAGPEAAPGAGAAMLPVPPARGAPPQGHTGVLQRGGCRRGTGHCPGTARPHRWSSTKEGMWAGLWVESGEIRQAVVAMMVAGPELRPEQQTSPKTP